MSEDPCSLLGARAIVHRLEKYWSGRPGGERVKFTIERQQCTSGRSLNVSDVFIIRSNLIAGRPPTRPAPVTPAAA